MPSSFLYSNTGPSDWIFSAPSPDCLDIAMKSCFPDMMNTKEREMKRNVKTKRVKNLLSFPEKMIRKLRTLEELVGLKRIIQQKSSL